MPYAPPPLKYDATVGKIEEFAKEINIDKLRKQVFGYYEDILKKHLPFEKDILDDPLAFMTYLNAAFELVNDDIVKTFFTHYSTYRWLWYLRRCSDKIYIPWYYPEGNVFWVYLREIRVISEALAGKHGTDAMDAIVHAEEDSVEYKIDMSTVHRVVKYISSVACLYRILSFQRFLARGGSFIWPKTSYLPVPDWRGLFNTSNLLYEKRLSA